MNILFVCTGNTCRSPMAEGLLLKMAAEQNIEVEVQSAGVATFPGSPISAETDIILRNRGLTLQHQTQAVTDELIHWADLILTMTESHKQVLRRNFAGTLDKVYTLKEYIGASGSLDIIDPYGGSLQIYHETEQELEAALREVLKKIKIF